MRAEEYRVLDGRKAVRFWLNRRLMVGGEILDAADGRHLAKDYGCTHSLSVQNEAGRDDEGKFPGVCIHYPTPDDGKPFPRDLLQLVLWRAVDIFEGSPGNVLYLHCQLGGSRSPSLAWMILRGAFGVDREIARQSILQCRPEWPQHKGYEQSIDAYLADLFKKGRAP